MSPATLSKPGTLIHARGREWVVLPDSTDDLLMARPVGGLDEEVTGILPAVETVAPPPSGCPRRPTSAISPPASSYATRRASPRAPPPGRSAASGALRSNRGPTSSCR